MKIRARLEEMASNEIAAMIDADTLSRIKTSDPHPLFKAFVVGHEGEAKGNMVGVGNIVKRWFRSAIEALHGKITTGLQLFHGHQEGTNDTAGRQAIGEVVGKKAMQIGEKLSSVVACYIYPSFRHLPLDVASIEAVVSMEQDAKRGLYIGDVESVTGIALGNSSINAPGFAGATLLGQLQAFAKGVQFMKPTSEEIRNLIREAELHPSDLFDPKELMTDPLVKEQMAVTSPASYEFARLRRELGESEKHAAQMEKEKNTLADKVKAQEDALVQSSLLSAKAKVAPLFEQAKATRKLDERQSKFILNRLERFTPSKPEDVTKEFDVYLDSEVDEYGKLARDIFGVEAKKVEGSNGKPTGTEPEDKKPTATDNKYLDPAQNPMIKLD